MFSKLSSIAVIVALSLAGSVAPSFAQNLGIEIGPNGVRTYDPNPPRYRHREYRRYDRGRCYGRQAEDIAARYGFYRPRVVHVGRTVVVEGYTRRGIGRMRFANEYGCPILR
ncbi:hypothetical protein [Pararhizobium mangrovi]|uniref:Antifreeze protein n=1 Tax=Pararhizobium mangrovi TaxID=2590452 RepID=A0A506UFT2_9HYPH|nr:hypothetical protein [Pararhizobium mangrovi]TPW31905.1 hypothetical protein FJU11_02805 [Pararhizobium mangrovi]